MKSLLSSRAQALISFPLIAGTLLSACGTAEPLPVFPSTDANTPSPGASASPTSAPSSTHSPSATSTLIPPTLTPLPTLADPSAEIRDLIRENAGCLLPCWWGITPGTTSWLQASQFFARFSEDITIELAQEGHYASGTYQSFIVYYTSGLQIDYAVSTSVEVRDGLVRSLHIDGEGSMAAGLSPRRLLSDLGSPDAILVDDVNVTTLWYESRGAAASFLLEETPSPHQLCVSGFWGTLAWDPSDPGIASQSRASVRYYQATSLHDRYSIADDQFIDAFLAPDASTCIPVPDAR